MKASSSSAGGSLRRVVWIAAAILALVLLLSWWAGGRTRKADTAAAPAPAASVAALAAPLLPPATGASQATPDAAATPFKVVLYFPFNSPLLRGDEPKKIERIVAALQDRPEDKATIAGFHSASGRLAHNRELAHKRAFAIRDALAAAGIEPARIVLDTPQSTEANVRGEDPLARRVEVTVQ